MKARPIILFIIKAIGVLVLLLLMAALFLIQRIDRTPYEGSSYQEKMQSRLDSIPFTDSNNKGKLKAGWSKVSIIPKEPLPIASYGIRDNYTGIHDTVWCKTILFDNGINKAAFVTLDILIFPPSVIEKLKAALPIDGIPFENLYVSTSHTHNGPGGWAKGLGGRILAGPYNEAYVDQLTNNILTSIHLASKNISNSSIGYKEFNASEFIENRYSKKASETDTKLRVVKIKKENGETACLTIFAGHANTLSSQFNELSGDYAGQLTSLLETNDSIQFAAFAAGAVATHNCHYDTLEYSALTKKVSTGLYSKIIKGFHQIPLTDSLTISSLKLPVALREPQTKIAQDWKIRPWLFYKLLGKENVYISQLRIGDILFIGTPCDFAGGLSVPLYDVAKQKGLTLIITSFNGGYIGYVLPDKYYDINKRESRDMDWFGPNSGSYLSNIITELIKKNQ